MVSAINTAIAFIRMRFAGEDGQDLIEYVMLSGLIAGVIVGIVTLAFTGALQSFFDGVGDCVDFAASTPCSP